MWYSKAKMQSILIDFENVAFQMQNNVQKHVKNLMLFTKIFKSLRLKKIELLQVKFAPQLDHFLKVNVLNSIEFIRRRMHVNSIKTETPVWGADFVPMYFLGKIAST